MRTTLLTALIFIIAALPAFAQDAKRNPPVVPSISESLNSLSFSTPENINSIPPIPILDSHISEDSSRSPTPRIVENVPSNLSDVPMNNLPVPALSSLLFQPKSPAEEKLDREFVETKQMHDLKQRSRIAEYVGNATQRPTQAKDSGSATVYTYREGAIYLVYAGVERVTDIALQPGEKITADPVAGDTERWIKSTFDSGEASNIVQHIVIKPKDENIQTNLIIPTNRHVYILDLRATPDWYMPSVRWTYPDDDAKIMAALDVRANELKSESEPLALSPENLNFRYKIKGKNYPWKPSRIYDDGVKTYLVMPATMNTSDAPTFFVIENKQPLLVAYRVKGNTYIVDRLFDRGELRVGADHVIPIERCTKHTWFCPG